MNDRDKKICFVVICMLILLWSCSCTDNRIRTKPSVPEASPEQRELIIRMMTEGWGPMEVMAEIEYQRMKGEQDGHDIFNAAP
ncbi:hypothetical protein LCGC14_1987040 [marine sediment metagenome]|uniref:Uncharacterized protein n=1 Tax=marine sediment metagenome TaxID=412755 RepID=A0A0F9HKI3_9ZZZZ